MNIRFIKKIGSTALALLFLFAALPTWALTATQVAKLVAADGAAGDIFGDQVVLDGDTALVSSNFDDDNGIDSGSAYVFVRSTTSDPCPVTGTADPWCQQAKLLAADGMSGDKFGFSMVLDDDTALIGAILDDDNGSNSGSAYVFVRNTTSDPCPVTGTADSWCQQAKLLPADGSANDSFGYRVGLDRDVAVVSALGDDDNGIDSGSAYVFVRNTTSDPCPETGTADPWCQQAKLLPADGRAKALPISRKTSTKTGACIFSYVIDFAWVSGLMGKD